VDLIAQTNSLFERSFTNGYMLLVFIRHWGQENRLIVVVTTKMLHLAFAQKGRRNNRFFVFESPALNVNRSF
jgi:hypothetical protein